MGRWTVAISTAATGVLIALAAPTAHAVPVAPEPGSPRTSISFQSVIPGIHFGTSNEHEIRSGLSIVKLYMADFALRHGDGSGRDRALAERMIRFSDDNAAARIHTEYPRAIAAIAADYRLPDTRGGDDWSSSYTSTADVAAFLQAKQIRDPRSPILSWMASASGVAADGTRQNWGTARLPGVLGTKWGWSDYGPSQVASASFGPGFTIAAHTLGTPAEQNADLSHTLPQALLDGLMGRGARRDEPERVGPVPST